MRLWTTIDSIQRIICFPFVSTPFSCKLHWNGHENKQNNNEQTKSISIFFHISSSQIEQIVRASDDGGGQASTPNKACERCEDNNNYAVLSLPMFHRTMLARSFVNASQPLPSIGHMQPKKSEQCSAIPSDTHSDHLRMLTLPETSLPMIEMNDSSEGTTFSMRLIPVWFVVHRTCIYRLGSTRLSRWWL